MDSKIVEIAKRIVAVPGQHFPREVELARAVIAMADVVKHARKVPHDSSCVQETGEAGDEHDCDCWSGPLHQALKEYDRLRRSAEGGK